MKAKPDQILNDETLSMSVGPDNCHRSTRRYEYVIFRGEKVIARSAGFKSKETAKRAGLACAAMF